ncbi:MAG: hypothetical protein QXN05_01705 [Acidilobaceae archaeon]
MRLSKREIACALKLVDSFGLGNKVNIGLVLAVLEKELCMSRKASKNSLKRLSKLGFIRIIKTENELLAVIEDPISVLRKIVESYVKKRSERCKKSIQNS